MLGLERLRSPWVGWLLLVLVLHAACAGGPLPGRHLVGARVEPGLASATVYVAEFMEPGAITTRPVRIPSAEFQHAFQRLAHDVRLKRMSPREAAHAYLGLVATKPDDLKVTMKGDWEVEYHPTLTF